MDAPEYRQDRPNWLGRMIALSLAGWFIWFVLSGNRGNLRGSGAGVIPLIPLAVIWFPEVAGQLCREKLSPKTAARLGRLAHGDPRADVGGLEGWPLKEPWAKQKTG